MDNLTERDEELLEALYVRNFEEVRFDLSGLENFADRMHFLSESGLVDQPNGEVRLTAKGLDAGSKVIRRHRLAERLISDVFGAGEHLMHERACKFEHIIDKDLDQTICTLLGHPTVCPHGKPIPRGACCDSGATQVQTLVTTLAGMNAGDTGNIAYLHSSDNTILNKLMALGVVPGSRIELIQSSPSYAFQAGESQFAVDREIASCIFVRLAARQTARVRRRVLDIFKHE